MKHIIKAITINKLFNIAQQTDIIINIIDHAANSAGRVADFLDKIMEGSKEELDDLQMS